MNIGLFGYDFPHIKTCDFMLALEKQHDLKCVLAAPWRELNIPKNKNRVSVKREPPFHPREIADLLRIPFHSVKHDSERCLRLIKQYKLDVAFIGGARILKKKIIDAFNYGIVNIHPGLLPENRGLDTTQWAIYWGIPQGITSHFIDRRVDAGRLILRELTPVFKDDTIYDVTQRIYDQHVPLLKRTLKKIKGKTLEDFPRFKSPSKPHGKIPAEVNQKVYSLFKQYLDQ